MNGAELNYDPTRQGPMVKTRAGLERAAATISRASFLRELTASLEETQEQASEIAGRLRNNADSLLGGEPEPGRNGVDTNPPPIPGQIHQLTELVRNINVILAGARHQLGRLDAL